jgi:hypothetical protein
VPFIRQTPARAEIAGVSLQSETELPHTEAASRVIRAHLPVLASIPKPLAH